MIRNPHEIVTLDNQPETCSDCGWPHCKGCGWTRGAHADHCPEVKACDCGHKLSEHRATEGTCLSCGCLGYETVTPDDPSEQKETLMPHIDIDYGTGKPKPMRIRYMELPGEINPNTHELATPFVIVIDRVTGDDIEDWLGKAIAFNTGARGVLVFEQEIQIGDDPE